MCKKFKVLIVIISLALTLSLMSNTYSRYIADTTGNLEVVFSKWQILVNNTDITDNESRTITLTPVLEDNVNVKSNTIAPSSKGYFDIDVDPSNVNVSFNYSVTLGIANENMPDLIITKYALLDKDYVEGDNLDIKNINNNAITGTMDFNNTSGFSYEPFTIRVFFEWYEGTDENMNDEADTEVGKAASNDDSKLEINANIKFEQKISQS